MPEPLTHVMVPAAPARSHRTGRWFFVSTALLMILLNVVAFGPSLIEPSGRNVPLPLTPLVTAHALVAAAWLLLFLLQAGLVASARTSIHRRVGTVGALLTAAFIVLAYFVVIDEARRGFN